MKKEEVGRLTEQRALDTLTEKIESFEIEGNDKEQITLYLYPLQLGRLAMISRRLIDLDLIFDDEQMEGAVKRMWTICSEKSKEVAEIIAIATLRTQQEIEDMLKERTKLIYWSPTMDTTALTNILSTIVFQSYYADFMNAISNLALRGSCTVKRSQVKMLRPKHSVLSRRRTSRRKAILIGRFHLFKLTNNCMSNTILQTKKSHLLNQ